MQHAVTRQAALGRFGPMADRSEARFYRIAGPDALPVPGRKIVEGQQLLPVLVQADGRLRVLRLISLMVTKYFIVPT